MPIPSKKAKQSDLFFNQRVVYEDFLNSLEKQILDQESNWKGLKTSIEEMKGIAEANGSVYFLHRVQRLEALTEKLFLKKSHKKEEFDLFHKLLEKITNNEKIEFLDSALKNRIGKVAIGLKESIEPTLSGNSSKNKKANSGAQDFESYIAFRLDTVRFLIPRYPFRVLNEMSAYRSKMVIGNREVSLFPGPGFGAGAIEAEPKLKKKILLLMKSETDWEGFYFDELEEEWNVTKGTIESKLDLKNKSNQRIWGTVRKKGRNYHFIKLL